MPHNNIICVPTFGRLICNILFDSVETKMPENDIFFQRHAHMRHRNFHCNLFLSFSEEYRNKHKLCKFVNVIWKRKKNNILFITKIYSNACLPSNHHRFIHRASALAHTYTQTHRICMITSAKH